MAMHHFGLRLKHSASDSGDVLHYGSFAPTKLFFNTTSPYLVRERGASTVLETNGSEGLNPLEEELDGVGGWKAGVLARLL
jgi:hypothetical protein